MTTITIDEDCHANVVKLQSILTLTSTSGAKFSLSDTVNYAVVNALNSTSFAYNLQAAQSPTGTVSFTTVAPQQISYPVQWGLQAVSTCTSVDHNKGTSSDIITTVR